LLEQKARDAGLFVWERGRVSPRWRLLGEDVSESQDCKLLQYVAVRRMERVQRTTACPNHEARRDQPGEVRDVDELDVPDVLERDFLVSDPGLSNRGMVDRRGAEQDPVVAQADDAHRRDHEGERGQAPIRHPQLLLNGCAIDDQRADEQRGDALIEIGNAGPDRSAPATVSPSPGGTPAL
jgi:hypothetical protein